jgi:hypothetical protein
MPDLATPLPCRRPELVVGPLGAGGSYVIKDRRTGAYYHLGDEEHFLLTQLDGRRDAAAICTAFAERFGQPLSHDELQEFLAMAEERDFLQPTSGGRRPDAPRSPDAAPFGLRLLQHPVTWPSNRQIERTARARVVRSVDPDYRSDPAEHPFG